ncbi:hypothetical protein SLNWT_0204 [Streptomyces albus]|uniref:Uncharacterized protein n=2 Tax=Streptomyces TaxID=1883 RepID=A0A0B5EMI8_STRA4|nr:hypothetical protein SLNWT_0204 [Streptomyces albus]AOU74894.1 hypothetical protein SLNHY_0203 [Streptomyces albus]AYN30704.1 hypothetical protein DUI70_0201 [Streptomyces albus]
MEVCRGPEAGEVVAPRETGIAVPQFPAESVLTLTENGPRILARRSVEVLGL